MKKNPLLIPWLAGLTLGYLVYSSLLYWLVAVSPSLQTFIYFGAFMGMLFFITSWARRQKRQDDNTPKTSTYVITFLLIIGFTFMFYTTEVRRYWNPKFFVLTTQTADWKTYTNAQYGFEFKYPLDWSLFYGHEGVRSVITIAGPNADLASIVIMYYENEKDFKINSIPVPENSNSKRKVFINDKGNYYEISYQIRYNQTWNQLEQIVQTFKFIK